MKKKHIIYILPALPLTVALSNINESNAFFKLGNFDNFIYKNKTTDNVVNIEDKNLLKAINKQLGRGEVTDNVSKTDMESLRELKAEDKNIASLKGLESAINLNGLHLGDNKISDISMLSTLTDLNTLDLGNNKISNILVLNGLTNLEFLNLSDNEISDVSILSSLSDLNSLHLHGNQVSNISALSDLTNLNKLSLNDNQISDISPLSRLTELNTLYLYNNQISDISVLSGLTNLNTLYLYNNQISDISALSKLTNLNILSLNDNRIDDISALSGLTNLKELKLGDNQISNIYPLNGLINLNLLYLGNNKISDISILNNFAKLNKLELQDNKISDISSLSELINLNKLELQNNQLSNISALNKLTNINTLYLYNNQISDISVLSELTKLNKLELQGNLIFDISPIKKLNNISTLNLSSQNPIINIGNLKTETDILDVSIKNPIIGLNSNNLNISAISDSGAYENGKLKWGNLPLGNHARTFNFSENVTIGSETTEFNGNATLNLNIVDGGAPEASHTSEFNSDDFNIYTIVTANDLGVGVDYLMHKGVRQTLPYKFKYNAFESSNNEVEIYDLVGNKADYQVKLKDSDIPTIEQGLETLCNKNNIKKEEISYFRTVINDLDESMKKDLLQDKLNSIFPDNISLDRKMITSNMDLYIKSENMLSMTLDTNSITFEEFSGIEDMEKQNVVNISINSSLPYQLNAYLPTEIQNSDKANTMDLNILNIKENSEVDYQTFTNTTDKIVLKENCLAGNNIAHNIDLKLKGGIAHEKDVYKTTIKFEVEQK